MGKQTSAIANCGHTRSTHNASVVVTRYFLQVKLKVMQWRIRDLEEQNDMFRQTVDDFVEKVCAAVYHSLFCIQRVVTLRRFGFGL